MVRLTAWSMKTDFPTQGLVLVVGNDGITNGAFAIDLALRRRAQDRPLRPLVGISPSAVREVERCVAQDEPCVWEAAFPDLNSDAVAWLERRKEKGGAVVMLDAGYGTAPSSFYRSQLDDTDRIKALLGDPQSNILFIAATQNIDGGVAIEEMDCAVSIFVTARYTTMEETNALAHTLHEKWIAVPGRDTHGIGLDNLNEKEVFDLIVKTTGQNAPASRGGGPVALVLTRESQRLSKLGFHFVDPGVYKLDIRDASQCPFGQ